MSNREAAVSEVTEASAAEQRKPKTTSETRNVVYYTVPPSCKMSNRARSKHLYYPVSGSSGLRQVLNRDLFLAIFAVFSGIGISQVMVRDIARNPALLVRRSNREFTDSFIIHHPGILQGIAVIAATFAGYDSWTFAFIAVYGFSSVLLNALVNRFYLSFFQFRDFILGQFFLLSSFQTQILGVVILLFRGNCFSPETH